MKTIIFDMDGTLADSFELALEIAHDLTGIPRKSKEEIDRLRGLPVLKVAREVRFPFHRLPRLILKARQVMHERMEEVSAFDGIGKVLETLDARDYHMLVMSSNSEQNIRVFLRANKLEQYFDGVYGNIGLFDKSRAIRKVLKRNKLVRQNCYYIGDEVRDISGAKKAGVHAVAVSWGYQHPDALRRYKPFALVETPKELLEVFDKAK